MFALLHCAAVLEEIKLFRKVCPNFVLMRMRQRSSLASVSSEDERYPVGSQVVIVGKRLPDHVGHIGTVMRVLPNPEGIQLLDQYIVLVNGQEISFRANEVQLEVS